jgi:hypothetical protein
VYPYPSLQIEGSFCPLTVDILVEAVGSGVGSRMFLPLKPDSQPPEIPDFEANSF